MKRHHTHLFHTHTHMYARTYIYFTFNIFTLDVELFFLFFFFFFTNIFLLCVSYIFPLDIYVYIIFRSLAAVLCLSLSRFSAPREKRKMRFFFGFLFSTIHNRFTQTKPMQITTIIMPTCFLLHIFDLLAVHWAFKINILQFTTLL